MTMLTTLMNAVSGGLPAASLATVPPLRLAHSDDVRNVTGGFWENIFFRGGGNTATSAATDGLFMLIFWFGVFWFVLLSILWIYWAIKYRRRPGVPAEPSPSHNTLLEIIWTIVPSSALIVLFLLGFWTYMEKQVFPGDAIELRVSGWKWGWAITYPGGEESQWTVPLDEGNTFNNGQGVPVFVVPEETNIALRMLSQDVLHAFWIPDFRVKMDLHPNRYTGYTFKTPKLKAGSAYEDHWIFCAEYCGDLHSEMAAILRVVPKAGSPTGYQEILASWNQGDMTPVQLGQSVAAGRCYTCHSVDGSAMTGPTWQNLYGYEVPLQGGGSVLADENYLRESILVPGAKIHAGYANQMPSFQGLLSEAQVEGLIAYMKTLSDKYEPPAEGEAPADGEAAPADGEAPADGDAPAEGDAPADGQAPAADDAGGEMPAMGSTD